MKISTIKLVKELSTTFMNADILKPNTDADMMFTINAGYGQVYEGGHPDPSKCYVTDQNLKALGENSSTFLQLVNSTNQPCKGLAGSIICELIPEFFSPR